MTEENVDGFDANQASKQMDLYSRAIAALGLETMKNLASLSVLVIGLRGVGVETAKNMILGGPKAVTVWDPNQAEIADLGANFYLKPEHVGTTSRGEASVKSLAELNPYVQVTCHTGDLTDEFLNGFGAVVVTDFLPKAELLRINAVARQNNSAFILAITSGITAHFFSDFGPDHVVSDADGEPSKTLVIEELDSTGLCRVAAKQHGFDDNDRIRLEDLESVPTDGKRLLVELNGLDGVKVQRQYEEYTWVDPNDDSNRQQRKRQVFNVLQIDLSDAAIAWDDLCPWRAGGIINELKPEKPMAFKSLEESLRDPSTADFMTQFYGPMHPDQGAWSQGVGKTLHLAFATALEFHERNGAYPRLHSAEDGDTFVALFEELNAANKESNSDDSPAVFVEEVDQARVRNYALYFPTELTGFAAFLGGVAAQEVVKKFGKYTPMFQWLQTDETMLIGDEVPADGAPQNSRYDHQIALFGSEFQTKISNQRLFLVGCGALGCEYMKGLAMMGVATGPAGQVFCTDMDRIELSNLSRQFLFRNQHVGDPKSTTAATVAKEMNPDIKIEASEMKVWEGTEDVFDDAFWDSLDLCWNALDNIHARKYTDKKCLFHSKPLLESGTQGTKCNSEVIIPFKTKSYNDGEDQETGGIAACTLRNFPHLIVHCIEWARPQFGELFELSPKMYNTFLEDSDAFFEQASAAGSEAEQTEMLECVAGLIKVQQGGVTFEKCVEMAFEEFVKQHVSRIKDLVYFFPEDERVTDAATGTDLGAFWSGHKRFPLVADYTVKAGSDEKADDEVLQHQTMHIEYMFCAANLYAYMFGLDQQPDRGIFEAQLRGMNLQVPEWKVPKGGPGGMDDDVQASANAQEVDADADARVIRELDAFLRGCDKSALLALRETEFEKDDDTNFHIDFITISSNMRAWNYRLKLATRHKCKIIAGKIIPALATTTAMITGLVELEFYKLLRELAYEDDNSYYNANINLAVSSFQFFQPDAAVKKAPTEYDPIAMGPVVPFPDGWTSWDKLVVDEGRDLSIGEFIARFSELFDGLAVLSLSKLDATEGGNLFTDYQDKGEALEKSLFEKYVELYGPPISEARNYISLQGEFENADGVSVVVPPIKYVFRGS